MSKCRLPPPSPKRSAFFIPPLPSESLPPTESHHKNLPAYIPTFLGMLECFHHPNHASGSSSIIQNSSFDIKHGSLWLLLHPQPGTAATLRTCQETQTRFIGLMSESELLSRITINPEICHGKPCIRGLRYPVASLLEYLAGGDNTDDLLAAFPDLEPADIRACLTFAA